MEMNDLNKGTKNINSDFTDEKEYLLGQVNLNIRSPSPGGRGGRLPTLSNIFGNFKPKGGDQVHPPDIHFSYIASIFIIVPTGFVLAYS